MADNKGEEEAMDTSSNSDTTTTTVPSAQDNTDPDASTKDDNAVIIIESDPTIKAGDEEKKTESPPENVVPPQAEAPPTPAATTTTNGGGGDANGAEANGNNSSSSTASPPTTTAENSTAEQPASVTTTPSPAPAPSAAAAAAGGDVTNNNNNSGSSSGVGLTTEMSPPPPAAAPGGGTTTPASTTTTTPPAPLNLLDTCAVCKQNLQSREVCEPKLLPCLHSFCLKCIPQPDRQISVQVPGQHGLTDTHIVNVMRCSVCHQDYKQSDIIDNYFVKDTSEATSSFAEKAAQVCTSCEDNAGTIGFCVECNEWLCKTCVEAHQRVKITKDHKIRTMGDDSAEAVAPGQRPVFCPVHRQEPLKLYCETCDTLTCRDCQLLEHKEHRYQFLEEAFQNQKGIIETHMTKLQEKKNYVHYSVSQVQSRIKELNETHRKVEHEIKIAVFTLINEINKKGKALLQQLESVTKERSMRLVTQHKDTAHLAHQINHVLNFCHWAITSGSSTALLYSKRLILFQLRHVLKARMEPAPQANGAVRFFCDPTFWAKNVVNLGNLVIEKPPQPPSAHPPPNMMAPGQPISPGQVHPGKHPPQINLAQLRLQHMQQAAYAQQKQQQHHQQQQQQHQQQQQQHQQQQQQHQQQQLQQQQQQQHAQAQQQQHQQQIQQQMRIASQLSQQHPRQAPPQMVQQQPPRLISMQQLPRGPGGMNGGPGPGPHMGYPSSHHMRLPGLPPPGRGMPTAQPRHNGQQYPSMMQPQLQRQHSNPGHAGPFPVASLHNANPTSPTSASMASAHAHRGPASPILGPIELIPSVTNPENLPCLPEIPPIQLEDAGSSNLGHILNRYLAASTNPMLGGLDLMNLSPGPIITHSPGSSGLSNNHTPARPSSTSSTGSRGSCSSAGRTLPVIGAPTEQVKVKQEPGAEDDYSCQSTGTSSNVKMERGKDAGRSACMMSSPESMSPLAVPVAPPSGQDVHRTHGGEHIKAEPGSEPSSCAGAPSTWTSTTMSATSSFQNNAATDRPLTNGNSSNKGTAESAGGGAAATANSGAKEDDPNEDWCAVCVNGGDLLCCDRCPKVFHMKCHVPTIKIFPRGDFLCTFCRNLTNPEIEYTDDTKKAKVAEHGHMGHEDRRKCERLLLYIFCHELSVGFRDPVASSVPNYYKIIKHPMDLKKVKKKLQLRSSQYYKTLQSFVSDVRLVFNNCAKYNEMSRIIQVYDEEKQINNQVGSEMAISGKAVSMVFEEKLLEMYPDQSFPETPEDESAVEEEEEKEATDDSGDDFVQPRRKRLKLEEKVLQHIK